MQKFNVGRLTGVAVLVGLLLLGIAYAAGLTGRIKGDGSSTVYPITEAVAEEFGKVEPKVQVTVGVSGTGGGFKKFVVGETDLQDASRPIKSKEIDDCKKNGVGFIELPVAFDGLTVVVNKQNTWVDYMTPAELKKIWDQGSTVKTWADVRKGWPAEPIKLFGPGADSGTFEYFTEAINGVAKQSRADYTASEDDNTLVQGVAGSKYGLGYFGMAYYEENMDKLKAVPIGAKKVMPSKDNVRNGTYMPLSRPLFIYISTKSAQRKEVAAFVDFYLAHAGELAEDVGYVALPQTAYAKVKARWDTRKQGSVFQAVRPGMTIEQIMSKEN
jgi:phosphate transport system substrate-binding protein